MTFESTGPPGNGNGCSVLVLLQLPAHTSNQCHSKINRDIMGSSTKYFTTAKFSIIRRFSGCFSRKEWNEMRELGMCHRRVFYVGTSWRFTLREIILKKWNLKCFCITAFLKCTLFLVPSLIYLQVALSNLIISTPLEIMNSFWPLTMINSF